jgi:hypothetical protein
MRSFTRAHHRRPSSQACFFCLFQGRLSCTVMKEGIETDFDEHDFLEGAQDAFYMVTRLWMAKDWETLETSKMATPRLLSAFR